MAEAKSGGRKIVFTKVDQLLPGTSGHTLTVKVVDARMVLRKGRPDGSQMRIAECLVGDETGLIVFTARNDQVDLMKEGSTSILRNARIDMFKGSMRLAVDKWGRVEVTEPASFTVKEDNNLSLVEYELVDCEPCDFLSGGTSGSESVNSSSSASELSSPKSMGKRDHSIHDDTSSKQSMGGHRQTTPAFSSNRKDFAALADKATVFVPDPMTSLDRPDDYVWVYGFPVVRRHADRYRRLVEEHGHPANAHLVSEINTLAQSTDNLLRVVQDIEGLNGYVPSQAALDLWAKYLGSARLMDFSIGWLDEQLASFADMLNSRRAVLPAEIIDLEERIVQIRAESEGYEAERRQLLEGIRSLAAKINATQGALSVAEKSLEEKKRELAAFL